MICQTEVIYFNISDLTLNPALKGGVFLH